LLVIDCRYLNAFYPKVHKNFLNDLFSHIAAVCHF